MKLENLTQGKAEQLGILPVYCRAQKLQKIKNEIDLIFTESFPDIAQAEELQRIFLAESQDAREGVGENWDYISLAITLDFDIPDRIFPSLAERCSKNADSINLFRQ